MPDLSPLQHNGTGPTVRLDHSLAGRLASNTSKSKAKPTFISCGSCKASCAAAWTYCDSCGHNLRATGLPRQENRHPSKVNSPQKQSELSQPIRRFLLTSEIDPATVQLLEQTKHLVKPVQQPSRTVSPAGGPGRSLTRRKRTKKQVELKKNNNCDDEEDQDAVLLDAPPKSLTSDAKAWGEKVHEVEKLLDAGEPQVKGRNTNYCLPDPALSRPLNHQDDYVSKPRVDTARAATGSPVRALVPGPPQALSPRRAAERCDSRSAEGKRARKRATPESLASAGPTRLRKLDADLQSASGDGVSVIPSTEDCSSRTHEQSLKKILAPEEKKDFPVVTSAGEDDRQTLKTQTGGWFWSSLSQSSAPSSTAVQGPSADIAETDTVSDVDEAPEAGTNEAERRRTTFSGLTVLSGGDRKNETAGAEEAEFVVAVRPEHGRYLDPERRPSNDLERSSMGKETRSSREVPDCPEQTPAQHEVSLSASRDVDGSVLGKQREVPASKAHAERIDSALPAPRPHAIFWGEDAEKASLTADAKLAISRAEWVAELAVWESLQEKLETSPHDPQLRQELARTEARMNWLDKAEKEIQLEKDTVSSILEKIKAERGQKELERQQRMMAGTSRRAAKKIQRLARMHLARKTVQRRLFERFVRLYDPQSQEFYYFDCRTRKSSWAKPKLLGSLELRTWESPSSDEGARPPSRWKPKAVPQEVRRAQRHKIARWLKRCLTRRKIGALISYAEMRIAENRERKRNIAATKVQSLFRRFLAKEELYRLISARYSKAFDPIRERYFYFDKEINTSSWEKPRLLRSRDLPISASPSSRARNSLTREAAATIITSFFRRVIAVRKFRAMIKSVYEKVFHKESGSYFYYNKQTGESTWIKPMALKGEDIPISPREATADITPRADNQKMNEANPLAQPKEELSEDEAARRISLAFKRHRALRLVRELVLSTYEKVYDPVSGNYFYYNRRTTTSLWKKPMICGSIEPLLSARDSKSITPRESEKESGSPSSADSTVDRNLQDHNLPGSANSGTRMQSASSSSSTDPASHAASSAQEDPGESSRATTSDNSQRKSRMQSRDSNTSTAREMPEGHHDTTGNEPQFQEDGASSLDEHMVDPPVDKVRRKAVCIQSRVRGFLARRRCAQAVKETFIRVFDPDSQAAYYYDKRSKQSQWDRPKLLGIDQVETTHLKEPNPQASMDEKALVIQRWVRQRKAIFEARKLVQSSYEKVLDPESRQFFYFNRRTRYSTWQKPFSLGQQDLAPTYYADASKISPPSSRNSSRSSTSQTTSRTMTASSSLLESSRAGNSRADSSRPSSSSFNEFGNMADKPEIPVILTSLPEFGGKISAMEQEAGKLNELRLDESGAVTKLQSWLRQRRATRALRSLIKESYQKVLDPESGLYYYGNHRTGYSTWIKPKALGSEDLAVSEVSNISEEQEQTYSHPQTDA